MNSCPNREALARWINGTAPDCEMSTVESHVATCAECQSIVMELASAEDSGFDVVSNVLAKTRPELPEVLKSLLRTESVDQLFLPQRYEFVKQIKSGGMGMVVQVIDKNTNRPLAIKVILPSMVGKGLEDRFLFEAHITAQLQHPGVPPVHEIDQLANGMPFFSMKLIDGANLSSLLRDRKQNVQHDNQLRKKRNQKERRNTNLTYLLAVFQDVAQTLAYAHSQMVIHRDLKPDNIMVGKFGEVQVMDWGLAKRLYFNVQHGPPYDHTNSTRHTAETPSRTDVDWLFDAYQKTKPGNVMGTYPYMPPEQARGEVDKLDERSDVFGLGAILCEILTGSPPFRSLQKEKKAREKELMIKAEKGDVSDAFDRLERCGVHVDLVNLAKDCLAPELADRLRDANVVAERIAKHFASEQERLQRERTQRVAAEVRVLEERKRSRVRLALVSVLFLLVFGASGVAYWNYLIRHETGVRQETVVRDVKAALDEVETQHNLMSAKLGDSLKVHELLSDIDGWKAEWDRALAAWVRADQISEANRELLGPQLEERLSDLKKTLEQDKINWMFAKESDDIRLEASVLINGKFDVAKAGLKYVRLFNQLELAIQHGDLRDVASRIRRHSLRFVITAALDHWAQVNDDKDLLPRILQAAQLADPDPWRDKVRNRDYSELAKLAKDVDVSKHSPQALVLLAYRLRGANAEARPILEKAVIHFPRDFWLYFELAISSKAPAERIGCWRAALAIRPKSSVVHHNLGNALHENRELELAIIHLRKALSANPNSAVMHNSLGSILFSANDLDGAIKHFKESLTLDNQNPDTHNNLGNVLSNSNDLDGAIQHFRNALAIDANYSKAHNDLGVAFHLKRDLEQAVRHYKEAIAIDPNSAMAHNNLGAALRDVKDIDGAIKEYRKAIAINANFSEAHFNLGTMLQDRSDLDAAVDHYYKALLNNPKHAKAHYHLGLVFVAKKDRKKALERFRMAIQLEPGFASAHNNLGNLLHDTGDLDGAIQHYRKALGADPKHANAHNNLGVACMEKNDVDQAIQHFRKAIEIEPRHTDARKNLSKALQIMKLKN